MGKEEISVLFWEFENKIHEKGSSSGELPLILVFVYFFHQFHDLFVVGTNLFNRNIMIDNVNDTCKIFAHICLTDMLERRKSLLMVIWEIC